MWVESVLASAREVDKPVSTLGIPEQIAILLVAVAIWLPWIRIFSKAGHSAWLSLESLASLAVFVPLLNLIVLFWFAFSEWPALRRETPSA